MEYIFSELFSKLSLFFHTRPRSIPSHKGYSWTNVPICVFAVHFYARTGFYKISNLAQQ